MRFDEVLRNPAVRRAIAAGEEQVGKVVGRLLANDRVTTGLQTLITSAVQARHTFERGVRGALHAANLPSTDDVAALKKRLDDLETTLDGLAARVAAKARAPRGEG
jgi:hypothetical protein